MGIPRRFERRIRMSDVTVIGLGAMGSAIANAFLNAGHDVTVWNRGPEKTELT